MDDKKKIRKGICRNYGDCDQAVPGNIIEVEEGQPFECPDCHEPLTEVDDNGKPLGKTPPPTGGRGTKPGPKPIVYIIVAAVVVIIALVAWLLLRGSDNKEQKEQPPVEVVEEPKETVEEPVVESIAAPEPESVQVEETKEIVKEKVQTTVSHSTPAQAPASGTHNLGYATWKGSMKNGKPHGAGTMTYSTQRTIDSRDSKGRVAQPNEYIIGEWDNGNLVQGRWFKNDGSKEVIIIGKAG